MASVQPTHSAAAPQASASPAAASAVAVAGELLEAVPSPVGLKAKTWAGLAGLVLSHLLAMGTWVYSSVEAIKDGQAGIAKQVETIQTRQEAQQKLFETVIGDLQRRLDRLERIDDGRRRAAEDTDPPEPVAHLEGG